jgi:predicted amidohydrolase YtcJ
MTAQRIRRFPAPRRAFVSRRVFTVIAGVMLSLSQLQAAPAEPADAVYVNGRIYTVDASAKWAQAVAIRAGRFVAVGDSDEIAQLIGSGTRVTDLGGRMAMPGVHDLHIHPLNGVVAELHGCPLPRAASIETILATIKVCTQNRPDGQWIKAGFFDVGLLNGQPALNRQLLDSVAPNHKVILRSGGGHAAWVNTAALQAAGITRSTPDPSSGFIGRDPATGEPSGVLFESAAGLVEQQIPEPTPDQIIEAVGRLVRDLNRQGVTSIKDAAATPRNVRAFLEAEQRGLLTLRVATAMTLRTDSESFDEQLAEIRNRERFRSARVNPDFVKIFVDGSAGARKAAFIDPYINDPQKRTNYRGEFLVPREMLKAYLVSLDRAGIAVKMHCGGDAARRAALDAIEAARRINGESGIPHEIAHPALLHPDDIPRFRQLNAIADLTPVAWYPNSIIEQLTLALGKERGRRLWQIRSMIDAGTVAVYGSDWPGAGPSTNPWRAMEAMITRRDPDNTAGDAYGQDQSVALEAAIDIFTRNGAYAMRHDDRVGTIAIGKLADMIVLDRNLFDIDPEGIDSTKVLLTLFEGVEVHRDSAIKAR